MPYCPKCGAEYRDGFSRCSDCDVDLVEETVTEEEHYDEISDIVHNGELESSESELTEEQKDSQHIVKPQPELGNEIALVTVDNQVELHYIISLLEENDIYYRVMERGIGQYLSIYMGTSYMGETIFIDKKDFNKAKDIVESYKAEIIE